MFSFFFKKARLQAALFALIPVLLAGLLVISCEQPFNGDDEASNAEAPAITVQPTGGTWDVSENDEFTLTVTANSPDDGKLSYQWHKNSTNSTTGGDIAGTTNPLTLEKAHYIGDGDLYFYVVVTNTNNAVTRNKTASVTSSVVKVTITGNGVAMVNAEEPEITGHPQGGEWDIDDETEFTLTVTANSPDDGKLSYQWYKNTTNSTTGGTEIGEDENTLSLDKEDYHVGDTLYFYVAVTNTIADNDDGGAKTASTTSNVATVTVAEVSVTNDPVIDELIGEWEEEYSTYTITDTTFYTGSEWGGYGGTIVNHRSDGDNAGYITIQYTSNDNAPEAVGSYYVIHYENLTASTMDISGAYDADDYDENGFIGKATQKAAERAYTTGNGCFDWHDTVTRVIDNSLVNAQQPGITAQPTGGTWDVSGANNFSLTVTASVTDGGELSFQWYKNTSNSTSGGTPIGTTNPLSLAKEDYTANGAYYFYVVVTNTITDNGDGGAKTAAVTSSIATVTVSGNVAPAVNAQQPNITAQPTGGFWNIWLTNESFSKNTAKLTVTANSSDGGNLSYQWYVNSANSESGSTLLTGKTSAALSLTAAEIASTYTTIDNGTNYFYVVVTNTIANNSDGGTKTATARSNIVNVTVDGVANGIIGYWYPSNFGGPGEMDDFIITPEFHMTSTGMGYGNIMQYQGYIQYVSFFSAEFGIIIVKYDEGHEQGWFNESDNSGDYFGIYIERYNPGVSWGITNTSTCYDGSYASSETQTLEAAIERFDENGEGTWFFPGLTPDYLFYEGYVFE